MANKGKQVKRKKAPIRWQWCRDDQDVTGHGGDERDADEARVWDGAHGDSLALAVSRSPRGRWMIDCSDGHIFRSWYDKRFVSPQAALAFVGARWGVQFVDAVCRCHHPDGQCD